MQEMGMGGEYGDIMERGERTKKKGGWEGEEKRGGEDMNM